jgi:hypothetical protein
LPAKQSDEETEPPKDHPSLPGKPKPSTEEAEMPKEHTTLPAKLDSQDVEATEVVVLEKHASSKSVQMM